MNVCRECSQEHNDSLQLGQGGCICPDCLKAKENRLVSSKSGLSKEESSKPPSNVWDTTAIIIAGFIAAVGVYLIFRFNNTAHTIWIIIIGYLASRGVQNVMKSKSQKHNEMFYREKESRIAELQKNIDSLEGELSSIYEEAVKHREQGRCQHCGRIERPSMAPFQVYNFSDAETEGSYDFSHLMLLCENCRSKIDESGNELSKKERRKKK